MIHMNTYPANSVVPVLFTSYSKTDGSSIIISDFTTGDIEVYKGVSMTQRSSDAGYSLLDTDGINIDGVTGLHGFSIDLGDDTDEDFYEVGSFYTVVVGPITVDEETVVFIADRFRIVSAETIDGQPKVDAAAINGNATAAIRLAISAGQIVIGTVNDDNTTPSTTVFAASDITEATADHFNGRTIIFTSGDLIYQATTISDYELDTGEGKFTVVALTEEPEDGDTFIIV